MYSLEKAITGMSFPWKSGSFRRSDEPIREGVISLLLVRFYTCVDKDACRQDSRSLTLSFRNHDSVKFSTTTCVDGPQVAAADGVRGNPSFQ